METLRVGSVGTVVERWQTFLRGLDLYTGEVTGRFDLPTSEATKQFQRKWNLRGDGIVGNNTLGKALAAGFSLVEDSEDIYDDSYTGDQTSPAWPPPPTNLQVASFAVRQQLFGSFRFIPEPTAGNPEAIRILGTWVRDHIVAVEIPQLKKVPGISHGKVPFHKAAAPQLAALFNAWEAAGLIPLIRSWGGSWAPRFIRGSRTSLSNHSTGTAFDINVRWNGLGARPALVGEEGSVRRLIPLANAFGFYWGGHYQKRPDGMHLECVKLLTPEELAAASSGR